jgi:Zn-dependent M16 (insulinase) family peptidase
MYAIKIKTNNTFFIVRIKEADIFDNKELCSPIYRNYKNLTLSVNLINNDDILVNAIATELFQNGITYGDVFLLMDNRENDINGYLGLLADIIKDVAMTTSEVRTLRKYEKIFKTLTTDDTTSESDNDEQYSNDTDDEVIIKNRRTNKPRQEIRINA